MATPGKDYAAIARRKITSPSKIQKHPRILVYGRHKKGKTRMLTTAGKGKILIADAEEGTTQMKKLDPDTWPITQWEDVEELYRYLRTGDHPYEWVALDTLTRIASMSLNYVRHQAEETDLQRRPGQTTKQDYGRSGELVKAMLYNFHSLPIGVVFTAQERMIDTVSMGDEDEEAAAADMMFVPDLPKGVRSSVNQLVDLVGRIYTVRTTVRGKDKTGKIIEKENALQRRLWIGVHESYDTGFRSDYTMPDFVKNPSIPAIAKLMREGQ